MKKTLKIAGILVAVAAVVSIAVLVINGLTLPSGSSNLSNDTIPPLNENASINIIYGKGATCPAGELYVDVHIKNEGYDSFTASGSKFVLIAGGIEYRYDFSGSKLLGWQNTPVANGERYDASIAFKVPDSTVPFVLNYVDTSTEFNIVCQSE